MEQPVYHLKGVLQEKGDAPADFTGPLDLILHLLKKNKLAIRDIPLAVILEQYLAWVEARRELNLEVAGEFISMASHLMLLKTKILLSQEDEEAKAEMEELMASLEARERSAQQVRLQTVLTELAERFQIGRDAFVKGPEKEFLHRVYRYEHQGEDLVRAMTLWRERRGRQLPPAVTEFQGIVRPEPYRVEKKTEELLGRLGQTDSIPLSALVLACESRSEATAVFLAVLELCRAGLVHLFGPMEDPGVALGAAEPPTEKEAEEWNIG